MRKGTDVPCVIVQFNKMRKGKEVHFVSLAKWMVDYEQSLFFLGPSSKPHETNDYAFLAQMATRFSRLAASSLDAHACVYSPH